MWKKGNPFVLLVGMQTGAATVESSMETSQKLKNGSSFWPRDSTSGNISEGTQNTHLKEHKHPNVHRSIIYSHQDMEADQVSINRWAGETTMRYLHNGILFSHKNRRNVTLAIVWMDLENIMLSEVSQSGKVKYHMISLTCGI